MLNKHWVWVGFVSKFAIGSKSLYHYTTEITTYKQCFKHLTITFYTPLLTGSTRVKLQCVCFSVRLSAPFCCMNPNSDKFCPPCKHTVKLLHVRIDEAVRHVIHYFTSFTQNYLVLHRCLQKSCHPAVRRWIIWLSRVQFRGIICVKLCIKISNTSYSIVFCIFTLFQT